MHVTFLGAAGCVTGSKHLIDSGDTRILIDCGLFQGFKHLRARNWARFPVDPASIDAVLLTHAHIDHSGYLPELVRSGFSGPIYATPATGALCQILLRDAAKLAAEDAEYANRKGFTRHSPARPLIGLADVERTLERFESLETEEQITIGAVEASCQESGHILGAVGWLVDDGSHRLYCSGDIGRQGDPLIRPPAPPPAADTILMESTYGGRWHNDLAPMEEVATALADTLAAGGVALVPSFAVGRTQNLLYCLNQAMGSGRLPIVPVHVDSPMATDVTGVYRRFHDGHRLQGEEIETLCAGVDFVASTADSKALTGSPGPRIVLAGSGMLTGGRVLHHLRALAGDERNLLLLPGYQAPGSRGGDLMEGRRRIKLHGRWIDVRLRVDRLTGLSAHADHDELLAWLVSGPSLPSTTFLVHGDQGPAEELRRAIAERYETDAVVPLIGDAVTL
ncbi:MAG: MBL fold metallo-hydrolase [Planctomycetota bacterium]